MNDLAWSALVRPVRGIARRAFGIEFDELMCLGCSVVRRFDASPHVSISFDDSPRPDTTSELLEALAQYNTKATFFVIGDHARRYPDIVRKIQADGHEIGNHTQHHRDLHRVSPRLLAREILQCQRTLQEILGARPKLFRAPYGHFRWDMRDRARLGSIEALVGWDVAPPYAESDPEIIADYVLERVRPGSIILLHDGLSGVGGAISKAAGRAAATSLHLIIPELQRRGLMTVPIGQQLVDFAGAPHRSPAPVRHPLFGVASPYA